MPTPNTWGEYLAEGAIAPMYMLRRGPWKFIHSPVDPDQLYNLARRSGMNAQQSRRVTSPGQNHARRGRGEVRYSAHPQAEVLQSQQARLMMFEAMKQGALFPWDFQPLRKASEQYTRNHMSVTERDLQSRYPHAPDIEDKRAK
jgi:choline-sulfatase